MNKLSDFQSFVYSNPFEIYCITETWLSDFVYDHEIIPSKFNIYRKDRKSHGGGVLVAVSESFQSSIIPSPKNLELISVSITHRDTIIICTVYIPPNSDPAPLIILHWTKVKPRTLKTAVMHLSNEEFE